MGWFYMNNTIEKKESIRVSRTKRIIKTAFVNLLKVNNISEITITEISKTAEINRKTFYTYYPYPQAVMEEFIQEFLYAFKRDLENMLQYPEPFYKAKTIVSGEVKKVMDENMSYYRILVCRQIKYDFFGALENEMKQEMIKSLNQNSNYDPIKIRVATSFYISGCIAAFRDCFENENDSKLERYEEIITAFTHQLFSILSE